MRFHAIVVAAVLFSPALARAEECASPSTCVPKDDLSSFVKLLQEKKCLQTEQPKIVADPIAIITDRDGRIYGSGANPVPWTLHMKWCSYDLVAKGQVVMNAAMREEPTWGFRFRPKASMGLLGVEAFKRDTLTEAVDVGLLVEPFFYRSWNVNVAVGMRSFGGGVGLDLTRNFGGYVGYAMTYSGLQSQPYAGLYFSFW